METIYWAIIVTALSAVLLLALLFIYIRNYKAIKSKFCMGLILFAIILLAENLASLYFQTTVMEHCSYEVAEPVLLINILEVLGFSALLYVTIKP